VLRSDWLTQGPVGPRFEKAIADAVGVRHVVAACNATAALHIACLALDLGPRDRFWTVPNTFVASANCGLYCGAQVDFVDIDERTYNMSPTALEGKLDPILRQYAQKALQREMLPIITRQFGDASQQNAHNKKFTKMLQVVMKIPS